MLTLSLLAELPREEREVRDVEGVRVLLGVD